jgi:hypothetical protein
MGEDGMSAHTKGPWIAADRVVVTTLDSHGYMTWLANCAVGGNGADEQLANARLIAAAPCLLAACQAMIGSNEFNQDVWNIIYAAVDKATRVEPKKATGEQE